MVGAFRSAGSLDFYWDANARRDELLLAAQAAGKPIDLDALPQLLPYAWEHRISGRFGFIEAPWFYDALRVHLPARLRTPTDAFVRTLYAEDPADSDDLSADSGTRNDHCVLYALRPSSTRAALERFDAVPWDALSQLGERRGAVTPASGYMPDYAAFETVLYQQREWLSDAAAHDHGVVAIISR